MLLSEAIQQQLENECRFSATRSSGPGGQNLNKVNTRVELRFSIPDSEVFSEDEKSTLLQKLKNRINAEGELILASDAERSQFRNRMKVTALFFDLLEKALTKQKPRKKTAPTRASRLKRMETKKILSLKKNLRRRPDL
ncbi:alternative ribosome rescue aminoacyl-tRNA hydrolase ArfB [Maribellus sediminis]|uniref:alternative ribosome rescue aminoacyl-tRNA hydrolase ArfB n=1 Tax=Maribellus sediminis TaxID=2696285 RepID=UPI00197CC3F4|nr:alternative ribosome rescue aminoacyl-tRNA hydrolase ArfB [Maribellus sediminis]